MPEQTPLAMPNAISPTYSLCYETISHGLRRGMADNYLPLVFLKTLQFSQKRNVVRNSQLQFMSRYEHTYSQKKDVNLLSAGQNWCHQGTGVKAKDKIPHIMRMANIT